GSRGVAETVEIAGVRLEREVIAGLQCPCVQEEQDAGRRAAESRLELPESRRQRLEVLPVTRVADVHLVRDRVRSPEAAGEAADDHETDTLVDENAKGPNR